MHLRQYCVLLSVGNSTDNSTGIRSEYKSPATEGDLQIKNKTIEIKSGKVAYPMQLSTEPRINLGFNGPDKKLLSGTVATLCYKCTSCYNSHLVRIITLYLINPLIYITMYDVGLLSMYITLYRVPLPCRVHALVAFFQMICLF